MRVYKNDKYILVGRPNPLSLSLKMSEKGWQVSQTSVTEFRGRTDDK